MMHIAGWLKRWEWSPTKHHEDLRWTVSWAVQSCEEREGPFVVSVKVAVMIPEGSFLACPAFLTWRGWKRKGEGLERCWEWRVHQTDTLNCDRMVAKPLPHFQRWEEQERTVGRKNVTHNTV